MNYLQLCQKMRRDIGVQGTGPTAVTLQTGNYQRIIDYVADADYEIQCKYEDWDFLRTTVEWDTIASTALYTQAVLSEADAIGKWDPETFSLHPDTVDFRPLVELDFHTWKNSGTRLAAQDNDEPTQFVIDQDESIILVPTPDAIYAARAEHWAAPVRMAVNGDVSVIPLRFHQMIIELATVKYGTYDENDDLKADAFLQYNDVWLPRLGAAELRGRKKAFASHDPDFVIVPE